MEEHIGPQSTGNFKAHCRLWSAWHRSMNQLAETPQTQNGVWDSHIPTVTTQLSIEVNSATKHVVLRKQELSDLLQSYK